MNHPMTRTAHVDAARAHLFAAEILTEPLIAVTTAGDQVMEGQLAVVAAQRAFSKFGRERRHAAAGRLSAVLQLALDAQR
jgi:hypothetical protein